MEFSEVRKQLSMERGGVTFKGDGTWGHPMHMTNACKWLRDNGIWGKTRRTPMPQECDRETALDIAAAQVLMGA